MDYNYIENLVRKSKDGDKLSKEKLIEEFRPFILNLSKRTFIDGYDLYDVQNECYKNLLKCLKSYNLEKHRFVAYATNGIKNNINDLIKRSKNRSSTEGYEALTLCDNLEHTLPSDNSNLEDILCDKCAFQTLRLAINNLSEEEKELIDFVFFKNNTIKLYSDLKDMCYSTAVNRKTNALRKINKYICNLTPKIEHVN
ncbi:sigma-70 family RNA polymerase sigma factor [Clostridium sp. CTA-5]